jgi:hypothetical protein
VTTHWEYLSVDYEVGWLSSDTDRGAFRDWLAKHGAAGWELVTTIPLSETLRFPDTRHIFIFKRPRAIVP